MRFTYPPFVANNGFNQTRRVMVRMNSFLTDELDVDQNRGIITASTQANSGGVPRTGITTHFRHHVHMTTDAPIMKVTTGQSGGDLVAFLDFDPADPRTQIIELRVGTSLIRYVSS